MDPSATSAALEERVWDALRTVIDPEAGMDVVRLGLVYGVDAEPGAVHVRMTMTSAACPMGDEIAHSARAAILGSVPEAGDVEVELVWDPPWTPSMMSEDARSFFGWQGS